MAAGGSIAKSSISMGDSGPKITGKWAVCEPIVEDGCLDVWLVNTAPGGLIAGLPPKKLTYMVKMLEDRGIEDITKLDGEAWFRCDFSKLDEIYPILGIYKSPRPPAHLFGAIAWISLSTSRRCRPAIRTILRSRHPLRGGFSACEGSG